MSGVKKSTFSEGGQGLLIGVVGLYAAYKMFPGMLAGLIWSFLPWACGLSLLTYVFLRLDLEG